MSYMHRGSLQRYILLRAFENRGRISRRGLEAYYHALSRPPKRKDQVDAMTDAIERLLRRGFCTALCVRTAKKWFIKEVRLTAQGRRHALRLFGEQQRLPLGRR